MATTKVGVYRSYYGPVPTDSTGKPIPKQQWPQKRPCSWVVRWFGTDQQRYSKSFASRKEADRFAEEKQSNVRQGQADPPPKMTLREFHKEHEAVMHRTVGPKTLDMQLAALSLLADAVGWDRRLDRLSRRDLEQFRAQRLAADLAPASVNREMRALKRVFNLAILRGYLPASGNPCIGLSMLEVERNDPPYCSPAQFQQLCQVSSDPVLRTMLVVLYGTGLRLREAMNLTWDDVDLDKGQVRVRKKVAAGYVQAWTVKTHEARSVPLPRQAVDMLRALAAVRIEHCPYVFMDAERWAYYRQAVDEGRWRAGQDLVNNLLRRFQTLCRQAKLPEFSLHDLRRSCITNWARVLPIHLVQQLAGHQDITTTREYYLSVQPEDVAKAQTVTTELLGALGSGEVTDQKLTNKARKRSFPQPGSSGRSSQTAVI